jgi:hypothetical protein
MDSFEGFGLVDSDFRSKQKQWDALDNFHSKQYYTDGSFNTCICFGASVQQKKKKI